MLVDKVKHTNSLFERGLARSLENGFFKNYSTVTLFAKLRGWSTSHPRLTAMS